MVGILHLDCGLHFPYVGDAEGTQICTVVQQFKISVLNHFSRFGLFPTLWTVACQAPLSMGILQIRILEWVAMPSSRASSQHRA